MLKEIEIGDTSQIAAASSLSDASHTNVSPRGKSLAYMILKKLYENNPKNVSKVVMGLHNISAEGLKGADDLGGTRYFISTEDEVADKIRAWADTPEATGLG